MVTGKQQEGGGEAGLMWVDIKSIEGCSYSKQHQSGVSIHGDLAPRLHSYKREDAYGGRVSKWTSKTQALARKVAGWPDQQVTPARQLGTRSRQLVTAAGQPDWLVVETWHRSSLTSVLHQQVRSPTPHMPTRIRTQRSRTMKPMLKCRCLLQAVIETTALCIITSTFLMLTKVRTTLATGVWASTLVSTHSCERRMTMTLAHSLHFLS